MHSRTVLALAVALSAAVAGAQQPAPAVIPGVPQCPSDLDMKNIETALSAKVVRPANATALHSEKVKAETCRRVGGSYSDSDWKRLRDVLRGDV